MARIPLIWPCASKAEATSTFILGPVFAIDFRGLGSFKEHFRDFVRLFSLFPSPPYVLSSPGEGSVEMVAVTFRPRTVSRRRKAVIVNIHSAPASILLLSLALGGTRARPGGPPKVGLPR